MAKKPELQPVTPDTFNISDLRRAAREGRLFILPPTHDSVQETSHLLDEMLAYVAQIAGYATPRYQPVISKLWHTILADDLIAPKTVIRKGRDRGRFNRYFITVLVCWMHEQGIYSTDIPAVRLHLILEHTDRRNGYYTGMGAFLLNHKECVHLRAVLKELEQS